MPFASLRETALRAHGVSSDADSRTPEELIQAAGQIGILSIEMEFFSIDDPACPPRSVGSAVRLAVNIEV